MHEEIKQMQDRRDDIAQRVRKIRKQFGRKMAEWYLHITIVPMKPTIENFQARIEHLLEVADTPIIPSLDEYYTRCGWEDGQYESKQDARCEAERLLTIVEMI